MGLWSWLLLDENLSLPRTDSRSDDGQPVSQDGGQPRTVVIDQCTPVIGDTALAADDDFNVIGPSARCPVTAVACRRASSPDR